MKMIRNLLALFFCASSSLAQGQEPLTIGTTSGYAPYVSLDSSGQYEGFDIDLAKRLADKLNRKLVIKDLGTMPSLMLALKQGRVDALIWAISITEERQQSMDFVYYQGDRITTIPILFWKQAPKGFAEITDLGMQTVCVEAGSYQEQVLKGYPSLKLKNVDKIADAILEIKFRKSTAIAIDNSLVATVTKQNPDLCVVYCPLPANMQSLGNGIAINKNKPQLTQAIFAAIEELRQEGIIQELEQKWNLK